MVTPDRKPSGGPWIPWMPARFAVATEVLPGPCSAIAKTVGTGAVGSHGGPPIGRNEGSPHSDTVQLAPDKCPQGLQRR